MVRILYAVAVVLALCQCASAGTSTSDANRPKIGLALSGGGARGAAHIGVLKVLEEHRIPVDYIAGTSMGALVGGFYASGMSPEELEALISRIDWVDAFNDKIPRRDRSFRRKRDDDLYLVKNRPGISRDGLKFPSGLIDGQKIDLLLKQLTLPVVTVRGFDELSIPYRAIATDIVTGETVVLAQGDLALAMRASMSIPALFAPREIEGRWLVDGGVTCNLPIDVVRRMGADVVIAVDISTPMSTREELESLLGITGQLSNILTRRNTDRQIASLTDEDIFIRPELGDITTASFERAGEAIPVGVTAAESVIGRLERLSLSEQDYQAHLAERTHRTAGLIIDEVRIVNESRLSNTVISARLGIEAGESLDIAKLEKDLGQIYGLELFESVYYDITVESGRTVLTVTVRENSWGPNYLQFGVAVFEDYEGPNFNLAAAYTRTAVNRLNGEWRTGIQIGREPGIFTEFYQPFFNNLRNFIHVYAFVGEQVDNVFDAEGHKTEELALQSYGGAIALGRELGTWGEIRGGIIRGAGTIKVQVGDPDAPDTDFDRGEAFAQLFIDELDNVNFPHSGGSARIRAVAGLEPLGSDTDYEQGIVEGSYAHSIGRNTGYLRGMVATTRDSNAPYQSLFRLGGFTRLSGLEHNELVGQHAALLSGIFYRNVGSVSLFSFYAGLSIEYGNVFQLKDDMKFNRGITAGSIFLGVDTLIGPIYLGYGRAEGGRDNFYLFLGQSLGERWAWFGYN